MSLFLDKLIDNADLDELRKINIQELIKLIVFCDI